MRDGFARRESLGPVVVDVPVGRPDNPPPGRREGSRAVVEGTAHAAAPAPAIGGASRPIRTMLAATTALCVAAACGSTARRPTRPEVDLHHSSPARRLDAVAVTARTHDTSQVPALFDLLDDDDDSVRLAAASALTDFVGPEPSYRAYASREERLAAAEAWRSRWRGVAAGAPSAPSAGRPGYTGGLDHVGPR